jgi:hypothetical protein
VSSPSRAPSPSRPAIAAAGCAGKPKVKGVPLPARYTSLPAKKVPAVFKNTIFEKCDLINTEPFLVNGYGFISNLNGTGSCEAPQRGARVHGQGDDQAQVGQPIERHPHADARRGDARPAQRDRAGGRLPPAGHPQGQRFDIQVGALADSGTTSLAKAICSHRAAHHGRQPDRSRAEPSTSTPARRARSS